MELVFLDTETTGNDVTKDRLCQVCYKIDGKTKTGFFKPPIPMSVKSMSITNITNKELAGKEAFAESAFRKELEPILEKNVLVAHNAKFDIAILKAEGVVVPRFICTLRLARHLDAENVIPEYNLQFLRYYLDLDVLANPHDAEGDVHVLSAVFDRLFTKMREKIPDEKEAIEKMIEISKTPSLFTQFNFGKYKDKRLDEVLKTDRRYLEWLLKEKMANNADDEDWIHTLKYYLK